MSSPRDDVDLRSGTCAVTKPHYSTRWPTPSLGTTPSSSTGRSSHHRASARARRGHAQEIEVEIGDVDHELEEELTWRVRYAAWHPTGLIRGPMGT